MKLALQIAAGVLTLISIPVIAGAVSYMMEASHPELTDKPFGFRVGFFVGQNIEAVLIAIFWVIFVALVFVGYRAFIRKP